MTIYAITPTYCWSASTTNSPPMKDASPTVFGSQSSCFKRGSLRRLPRCKKTGRRKRRPVLSQTLWALS